MATILILEDNEDLTKALVQMLATVGHETITAPDGRQVVEIIARQKVDLVLTDIFMPEKEGLETIEELRELHPDIPIIAMSGGGANFKQFFLETAQKLGAKQILSKPFTAIELLSAVHSALRSN